MERIERILLLNHLWCTWTFGKIVFEADNKTSSQELVPVSKFQSPMYQPLIRELQSLHRYVNSEETDTTKNVKQSTTDMGGSSVSRV